MIIEKAQNRNRTPEFIQTKGYIMITYCADRNSVTVFLCEEEVPYIRQAVKNCLESRGFQSWDNMEGELFRMDDRLLLFVRPLTPLSAPKTGPKLRLRRR